MDLSCSGSTRSPLTCLPVSVLEQNLLEVAYIVKYRPDVLHVTQLTLPKHGRKLQALTSKRAMIHRDFNLSFIPRLSTQSCSKGRRDLYSNSPAPVLSDMLTRGGTQGHIEKFILPKIVMYCTSKGQDNKCNKFPTRQIYNLQIYDILECGPMPNVMVALPNIGGALCSTPQSLADAHY